MAISQVEVNLGGSQAEWVIGQLADLLPKEQYAAIASFQLVRPKPPIRDQRELRITTRDLPQNQASLAVIDINDTLRILGFENRALVDLENLKF